MAKVKRNLRNYIWIDTDLAEGTLVKIEVDGREATSIVIRNTLRGLHINIGEKEDTELGGLTGGENATITPIEGDTDQGGGSGEG